MADTAKKKMPSSKMWIIGLVIVIIALGGMNFFYMKKIKDQKAALAAKDSGKDTSSMAGPTEETSAATGRTEAGNDNPDTPQTT